MFFNIFLAVPVWFLKIWISFLTLTLSWVWNKCCGGAKVLLGQNDKKLRADKLRIDKIPSEIMGCPEILEQIFKHSDSDRLKKYRLVSRAWNQAVCYSLSKSVWLVRVCRANFAKFRAEVESRIVSIPPPFEDIDFVADSEISRKNFLWLSSNFRITSLNVILFYSANTEEIQFMIQTCSPTLTHLYTKCCFAWDESIPMHFPHLQVLHVHTSEAEDEEEEAREVPFFVRLISFAPQLSRLIIGGDDATELLGKANLECLLELEILLRCSDTAVWQALEHVEMGKLTHLSVYISWINPNEDLERCEEALKRFSGSLRSLKVGLSRESKNGAHPSRFPFCPHLTHLELDVYSPDALDLSCFPALEHFTFWSVMSTGSSSSCVTGTPCSSVRNIIFKERVLNPGKARVLSQEREAAFLDLFRRFPNVVSWSLCYRNVVNFCRAAQSARFKVKSLIIAAHRRIDDDEEKFILLDKHLFSYVERLKDLESLGLYNCTRYPGKYIRVKELTVEKLPNLRVLQTRSDSHSSFEEYLGFKDLKIMVTGPRKLNGTEGILSKENVEFLPYPKPTGAQSCFCDKWDPHGRRL